MSTWFGRLPLGEFGGPNQQIAFARQRAIRPSEIFLNPSSGRPVAT
jgi:hypothetical protein